LLIALLFVLRVGACSNPSQKVVPFDSDAGPAVSSGSCDGYKVNYTAGGVSHTFACPGGQPCIYTWTAGCHAAEGQPPFRTCRTAYDCLGAQYCAHYGDSSVVALGSPECVDGICDWKAQTTQSCGGGKNCNYPDVCVISGTTSGGFPWGYGGSSGNPPTTSGGQGGNGGSDSSVDAATDATSGDASGN
jgi:hypothetical protein